MMARVGTEQLEAPIGDAKLVALGRVGDTACLHDKKRPVEHPAAFSEAQ